MVLTRGPLYTLKAKPRESFAVSFLKEIVGISKKIISKDNRKYIRLRLKGKNSNKNPIIFDTEVLRLREQIESSLNENGTVNTQDILKKMIPILKDLE